MSTRCNVSVLFKRPQIRLHRVLPCLARHGNRQGVRDRSKILLEKYQPRELSLSLARIAATSPQPQPRVRTLRNRPPTALSAEGSVFFYGPGPRAGGHERDRPAHRVARGAGLDVTHHVGGGGHPQQRRAVEAQRGGGDDAGVVLVLQPTKQGRTNLVGTRAREGEGKM